MLLVTVAHARPLDHSAHGGLSQVGEPVQKARADTDHHHPHHSQASESYPAADCGFCAQCHAAMAVHEGLSAPLVFAETAPMLTGSYPFLLPDRLLRPPRSVV